MWPDLDPNVLDKRTKQTPFIIFSLGDNNDWVTLGNLHLHGSNTTHRNSRYLHEPGPHHAVGPAHHDVYQPGHTHGTRSNAASSEPDPPGHVRSAPRVVHVYDTRGFQNLAPAPGGQHSAGARNEISLVSHHVSETETLKKKWIICFNLKTFLLVP